MGTAQSPSTPGSGIWRRRAHSGDLGSRSCPSNSLGDQRHQANSVHCLPLPCLQGLERLGQLISKCLAAWTVRGPVTQGLSVAWCGGAGPSERSLTERRTSPVRLLGPHKPVPILLIGGGGSGRSQNCLPRRLQDFASWRQEEMRKQFYCWTRGLSSHISGPGGRHPFSPGCDPCKYEPRKDPCFPFT